MSIKCTSCSRVFVCVSCNMQSVVSSCSRNDLVWPLMHQMVLTIQTRFSLSCMLQFSMFKVYLTSQISWKHLYGTFKFIYIYIRVISVSLIHINVYSMYIFISIAVYLWMEGKWIEERGGKRGMLLELTPEWRMTSAISDEKLKPISNRIRLWSFPSFAHCFVAPKGPVQYKLPTAGPVTLVCSLQNLYSEPDSSLLMNGTGMIKSNGFDWSYQQ